MTKDTTHLQGLKAILSLIFLGRFDKVAMVAALFQFHYNIQETRCASPCSLWKSFVVSCQNPPAGRKIKVQIITRCRAEPWRNKTFRNSPFRHQSTSLPPSLLTSLTGCSFLSKNPDLTFLLILSLFNTEQHPNFVHIVTPPVT